MRKWVTRSNSAKGSDEERFEQWIRLKACPSKFLVVCPKCRNRKIKKVYAYIGKSLTLDHDKCYKCMHCGFSFGIPMPLSKKDYEKVEKLPLMDEYVCERCGRIYDKQVPKCTECGWLHISKSVRKPPESLSGKIKKFFKL